MEFAGADAQLIYVGKTPGKRSADQREIEALLIQHARQGKYVVRLKGGDPFVVGRGGEEALALSAAGIPFEVVTGISAALAVPAYAGISVTHRGCASSFAVAALAQQARLKSPVTIVVGTVVELTEQLDWYHGAISPVLDDRKFSRLAADVRWSHL